MSHHSWQIASTNGSHRDSFHDSGKDRASCQTECLRLRLMFFAAVLKLEKESLVTVFMRIASLIILTLLLSIVSWSPTAAQDETGPRFEGKETLLRPAGYRQWVFVGSSLGLRYDPQAGEKPTRGP